MTTLTGTGKLVRLILRRDRLLMPLWILFIGVVPISVASSFAALYPTAAARQQFAAISGPNATFVALYGRLLGSSLGELVTWRCGFVPIVVGLISLLTVIRHTRVEEESGRRELVGSTVVGRNAGLAAALLATFGANLVLACLIALGMMSQHLPAAGSLALGAEFAAAGWVFAAIGGVAAQLTDGAGGARGIGISVLGAAYLLRVGGDLSGFSPGALRGASGQSGGAFSWLSWLSPIGWVQRIRPYGGDRWSIVVLVAGISAVIAAAALAVSARRDVGAGLVPARPGPATAAPYLRSPLALAWRLHRGLLAGWIAGLAAVGVVLGGVANSIGNLLQGNRSLEDLFTRLGGRSGIIDAYLAGMMSLLALLAAAYAIQATLRLRSEETSGRAEPVLATPVGRLQWAGSHLVFSILGSAAVLVTAGLTTGLTYGLATGHAGRELVRVLGAAVVQLPAVWVLAAAAVALVGLLPRFAAVSWGALALCLLFGLVGAALQLSQWLLDISPFSHIPKVPGAAVSATPLVSLVAVAVALGAAGLIGLRNRAIPVT
jgi:ABC-2 type transport system permease protein